MKSTLLILALFVLNLCHGQDNFVYQFDNIYFETAVPGAGPKKVERLAKLINNYIGAIEKDQYNTWYSLFSDSTISRVAPHKFPNKFRRLKEYHLDTDTIIVTSIKRLSTPFENEVGTEYEVTLQFNSDLVVANRVSFDHLKRSSEIANNRLFGMNIVSSDKGYKVCVHKYTSNGTGKGTGDNDE